MNQIQYGLWSEILLFESAYKKPSNVRFVNSFFFWRIAVHPLLLYDTQRSTELCSITLNKLFSLCSIVNCVYLFLFLKF